MKQSDLYKRAFRQ